MDGLVGHDRVSPPTRCRCSPVNLRVQLGTKPYDPHEMAEPPDANLRLLRRLARVAPPGLVITDVGSVKRPIVQEAARLGLRGFVGGHPMAGTEGAGFLASSPDLFLGRPWVVTPARDAAAVRRVRGLARAAGARPVEVEAAVHDRAVAFLSHLPQVVAWALAAAARGDAKAGRWLSLAGPASTT